MMLDLYQGNVSYLNHSLKLSKEPSHFLKFITILTKLGVSCELEMRVVPSHLDIPFKLLLLKLVHLFLFSLSFSLTLVVAVNGQINSNRTYIS